MIVAMIVSTALVPFGLTNVITYALSVAAIVITSVVLIQGYRDTAQFTPSSMKSSSRCVKLGTRWSA